MKRTLLLILFVLNASLLTASAAPFIPGNVVIYRVGSGTGTLVNTGNPVFLDEYSPTGTLVQSIGLPTTAVGSQFPLIASGTATSEGFLTLSQNTNFLIVTGYGTTIGGATSLSGTSGATVPRIIGRVAADGTVDTTTALSDFASGNNPRSAASVDGLTFYATGGAGGVRFIPNLGATTSTQLTTLANLRTVAIFDNQLYASTNSTSGGNTTRLGTVGVGLPTTSGQPFNNIPGLSPITGTSTYQFVFLDLDAGVGGVDTLYVADDQTLALTKYSLVGGVWTANGTIGVDADDYRGVTALVNRTSGSPIVTLYATRMGGSVPTGGGQLVTLTDSSGYNGAFAGTPTLLATAAANTAFRGVAFAPGTTPTAADAMIGGRVTMANGTPIKNVRLVLTNSLGEQRVVSSNAFGYFNFSEVESGQSYIVSAASKRYQFTQPTQFVNVNSSVTDVNFVAAE